MVGESGRQTNRQRDRGQTHRQTEGKIQAERETERRDKTRQTDRQTDRLQGPRTLHLVRSSYEMQRGTATEGSMVDGTNPITGKG